MKAVILCGGSGTRLWPISRKTYPKQFAPLFNGKSLFELTIDRNKDLVDGFIIIVNELQLELCKSQVPPTIKNVTFLIEPVGRNTAPAICLAALCATENENLLVLPSDHLIKDQDIYEKCVITAQRFAHEENLVTFGIKAQYPETGYGYIQASGTDVVSFKEKPTKTKAIEYVANGNYFWNSGMFLFNSTTLLREIEKHSPEIYKFSTDAFNQAKKEDSTYFIQKTQMMKIPEDSIDYAIMERSQNVKVVPSPFTWTDLGSFDSLYSELPKDRNGNTKNEKVYTHQSSNNLIIGGKRVITTFDVNDLIIVDTKDALLIGKKGESQNVKKLLEKIKESEPDLLK